MNLFFRLLVLMVRIRFRGRISIWDTARTPFRVNPLDLDVLMHMNNGRYLSILDLGRMDLMLRSGFWKVTQERGWYPVVAGQGITFRKSLELWQKFEVRTKVLGIDEAWVYMEQSFHRGDVLIADAVVRARFLKKTGGSVTSEELIEAVGGVPAHIELPQWVKDWTRDSAQHARTVRR